MPDSPSQEQTPAEPKLDGIPRTFDRAGWLEQLQEECERAGHSGITPCDEKVIAPSFGPAADWLYSPRCRICMVLAELHKLWEAEMRARAQATR